MITPTEQLVRLDPKVHAYVQRESRKRLRENLREVGLSDSEIEEFLADFDVLSEGLVMDMNWRGIASGIVDHRGHN